MTTTEEAPGTRPPAIGRPAALARARRALVPLLVAVPAAVSGVLLLLTAQARDAPAAANHALTDRAATDQVLDEVGGAVSRVFSYGPTTLARTHDDARALLGGRAAKEYEELFRTVQQRVPQQGLTLTTRVSRAGVTRLTDTHAELLLFLDQTSTRRGAQAATVAAQLSVTAEHTGGHWRITEIEAR
ncbi:hypothetical protein [Streptomyces sp. cg36]|uniref:hypothetical protein n=1 Tax=Streptomyces sp. cg36 TaxID=3238798 RepID=UPI0034E2E2FA